MANDAPAIAGRSAPGRIAALTGRSRGALAVVSGALLALGQVPFSLVPVALAGLAGMLLLFQAAATPRRAALTGWLAGTGYFIVALHWLVEPFLVDIARHGWMAPFGLGFTAMGLALFWGAAFGAARRWGGTVPGAPLALLVGTLGAAELARGYVLTGFPWALIGYVWTETPVAQLAAWIGPFGLTAATLALVALPLALLARGYRRGVILAFALPLAAMIAAGQMRLSQPLPPGTDQVLRLVQPNAPQREKWDPARAAVFLDRQIDATAALPRPDLVVWPETSVPSLLHNADDILWRIAAAAGGVPVVLGIQRRDAAGRYYNSLVTLDAEGVPDQLYDKHHLVPFGEYLPLHGLLSRLGLGALADLTGGGFAPGPGPVLLDFGALGAALPLICYEAVFPQDVNGAPARPAFLLQITNDAWFGRFSGPYQHLAQARMRAIEQGLPLARAANTGISAMIDPHGRITQSLALDTAGHVDAELPAPLPATPYARTGDWPALAALALLVLGAAFLGRRGRRGAPRMSD